jgi:uncharacterized protein (DUF488 family)
MQETLRQSEDGLERDAEPAILTVGHSNRSIDEFIELLVRARVSLVVDVRKIPRSRTNPQFNLDVLPEALGPFQIQHRYIASLGGRRTRSWQVPEEVNGLWQNRSFHNYADYALSDEFRAGLDELIDLSHRARCAVMCSEAVWWRCHRRLIADNLLVRGIPVRHIMGPSRLDDAKITPGAVIIGSELQYPVPKNAVPR